MGKEGRTGFTTDKVLLGLFVLSLVGLSACSAAKWYLAERGGIWGGDETHICYEDENGARICNPIITGEEEEPDNGISHGERKAENGGGSVGSRETGVGSQPEVVTCYWGKISNGKVIWHKANGKDSPDPVTADCQEGEKEIVYVNTDGTITYLGKSYSYYLDDNEQIHIEGTESGDNQGNSGTQNDSVILRFQYDP